MNRVDATFAKLRIEGRKAVIPFVVGSSPGPGDTALLIAELARSGAAVVEVGIPFSDPIADGPVIAEAMHKAIGRGATPRSVFDEIASARKEHDAKGVGIVAMMSVSLAWRLGFDQTIAMAIECGVDGFIFPDLPYEEAGDVRARVRAAGLVMPMLVAPTTPAERATAIARECSGFVYLLARTGITGEGAGTAGGGSNAAPRNRLSDRVRALREVTDLPLACGFGIATADDVRAVVCDGGADAAIVGSALVRRLSDADAQSGGQPRGDRSTVINAAGEFVRELVTAAG